MNDDEVSEVESFKSCFKICYIEKWWFWGRYDGQVKVCIDEVEGSVKRFVW